MTELKDFIHGNLCNFIKEKRTQAGFAPEFRLHGYTFNELEDHAEKIPLCDLCPILMHINDGSLGSWWFNFQIGANNIRQKESLK